MFILENACAVLWKMLIFYGGGGGGEGSHSFIGSSFSFSKKYHSVLVDVQTLSEIPLRFGGGITSVLCRGIINTVKDIQFCEGIPSELWWYVLIIVEITPTVLVVSLHISKYVIEISAEGLGALSKLCRFRKNCFEKHRCFEKELLKWVNVRIFKRRRELVLLFLWVRQMTRHLFLKL